VTVFGITNIYLGRLAFATHAGGHATRADRQRLSFHQQLRLQTQGI
jgi:hypothetical protein